MHHVPKTVSSDGVGCGALQNGSRTARWWFVSGETKASPGAGKSGLGPLCTIRATSPHLAFSDRWCGGNFPDVIVSADRTSSRPPHRLRPGCDRGVSSAVASASVGLDRSHPVLNPWSSVLGASFRGGRPRHDRITRRMTRRSPGPKRSAFGGSHGWDEPSSRRPLARQFSQNMILWQGDGNLERFMDAARIDPSPSPSGLT